MTFPRLPPQSGYGGSGVDAPQTSTVAARLRGPPPQRDGHGFRCIPARLAGFPNTRTSALAAHTAWPRAPFDRRDGLTR